MSFTTNEAVFAQMDDDTLRKNLSELLKLKGATANAVQQLPRALRLCKKKVNRRFLGREEKTTE